MPSGIVEEGLSFHYATLDIRELDADELLNSARIGDNVLAILCNVPEPTTSLRRILERLAALKPDQRDRAVRLLLILSGLRNPGGQICYRAQGERVGHSHTECRNSD